MLDNRHVFGWSLPPGVSMRDFDIPEPPAPLRCGTCGRFLSSKVDRAEYWEDGLDCDGSETFEPMDYSEEVIQILGEEYRGRTYQVSVSPCGVDRGPHEPHREIFAAGETLYRTCKHCGTVNSYDN